MLASVDPTLVAPREKVRRLGEGKWELKAVIDDECERGLKELKRLLSHTNPSMTFGELVGRLAQAAAPGRRAEGLDRHDPGRRGSRRDSASAPKSDEKPAANGASAAKSDEKPAANAPSAAKPHRRADAKATSATKSARTPAPNGTSPTESPTEQARASASAPKERGAGRAIPQATKRQLWLRDQGRCRYKDPVTGRHCTSRHLLQIDHIRP